MSRRRSLVAVLVALLAAVAVAAVVRPATAVSTPVRIMPLGDSITAGPGCWRAMLWHRLQTSGYTGVDFVGSQSDGGGCNPGYAYDHDHEGHGGFSATGIADNNQLPPWLDAARPDIVLMHLGTNDMWGGYLPLDKKLAAFTKLVGQMRANNPRMRILVAQIIPMGPSSCSTCAADVVALDKALPAWAAELNTAQSPVVVVDLWTGFDATKDTGDGTHPNAVGFQKMADSWYPAVAAALSGTTSPTTSPAPKPSARCSVTYRVVARWNGGLLAQVLVRNDSGTSSASWTADLRFAEGLRVIQAWNTTLRQNGGAVTARSLRHNGGLAAGQSTSFGFVAAANGRGDALPTTGCTLT